MQALVSFGYTNTNIEANVNNNDNCSKNNNYKFNEDLEC